MIILRKPMPKIEIIVECGHNWNGNLDLAKEMIWVAKTCGADVVKFQLYNTDYIKNPEDNHYWELKTSELSREDLTILFQESYKANIEFLCSVFDALRVQWTEALGIQRYKIASRSIDNIELIKAIEKTHKPIIASLGKWQSREFPNIKGQVDYLFCVSKYPALEEDMVNFPEKFDKYSGFSDHTLGINWAKEAIRRGAKIIEKHFTLSRKMPGCDQQNSIEPKELRELINFAYRWNKLKQFEL